MSAENLGRWHLPDRVEHTFPVGPAPGRGAWLNLHRRLNKDYEIHTVSSEAMIYIAMTRIMIRRLAIS